jgi:hypothetical protein
MPDAARRAAMVAPAARPAYSPVHKSFRSIPGSLPDDDSAKPGATVTPWNAKRRDRRPSGSA